MTEQTNVSARVLAAEDDRPTRGMLEAGLTKAGYQCVTAESARCASVLLQQEDFDLVLLDIRLQPSPRRELSKRLSERAPGEEDHLGILCRVAENSLDTGK